MPLGFEVILGLVISILTIYIISRISSSNKTLIHLSILPLIAGLISEYKRISQKWSTVLWTTLAAFVFSFSAFMPGKGDHPYILEEHIQTWPFAFLGIFILIAIVLHEKELRQNLTEGITLLQSIAIIYWSIDLDLWETKSIITRIVIGTSLLFAIFSFFNAFTNFILSRTTRLTLSIWSCFIMILFSVDNIYQVYSAGEIETSNTFFTGSFIAIQYFLLGVSSIYMANNVYMLMNFLPGKGTFFNAQYFQELKELKSEHIERFSTQQVTIFESFLCLLITGAIFGLNYYYNFVPRNFIIWLTFALFPFALHLLSCGFHKIR
jgi:hypothetical protein